MYTQFVHMVLIRNIFFSPKHVSPNSFSYKLQPILLLYISKIFVKQNLVDSSEFVLNYDILISLLSCSKLTLLGYRSTKFLH